MSAIFKAESSTEGPPKQKLSALPFRVRPNMQTWIEDSMYTFTVGGCQLDLHNYT